MLSRMNQKGEGRLGCVVGLLLLAGALFFAYKMIPVKIQASEMRDAVQDASRSASGKSQATIRKELFARSQELEVPIEEGDIIITRRADFIRIEVEYDVDVEFPGYVWKKHYSFSAENPVF
jgi:uncharacterized protein YxjI